jgi:hypothetical protein
MLTCSSAVLLTAVRTAASSRYLSSACLMCARAERPANGLTAAVGGGIARFGQTAPCTYFARPVIIGSIRSTDVPAPARAACRTSDSHFAFNSAAGWRNRITSESRRLFRTEMAGQNPLLLRLIASSVRIADRAGSIVRNIMSGGNLGIVDKVTPIS